MPSNDGVPGARPFRVLIIGGSYGGLSTALTLVDLSRGRIPRFSYDRTIAPPAHRIPVQITVVDERDGFFHLIGSPKALACEKFAGETWTRFQEIPALKSPHINFVQGSVSSVDFTTKTAQIDETSTKATRSETYDYLVVSSGLRRTFPTVPQSLQRSDFLAEASDNVQDIQKASEGVVVVGGGAVGVEMAAELKILYPQQKITLIHSRSRLLSSEPLPDDFAEQVDSILREVGVETILGQRVVETTAADGADGQRVWCLTLSDGRQLTTGHVLNAISRCIPTSTYLPSKALDKEGYVKIRPSLQFSGEVPNAEHHWCVGDLAAWPGIKRCGGAMHMGHYAGHNLYEHMTTATVGSKPDFKELSPFPNVIGLALGKKAVCWTPDEGTKHGEELMDSLFGKDMGNSICRNYMQFSEPCPS
ncbi:FAD-dependent pyridine nucleotide-disulfide oxidoreductase [Penicillium argentinense]|uniref:FAD-dependent pyridine nucleotide-disulfide oxidoreductase n=1 Tax=Penicillium argentinense TaxID=1131581 RepID=A0A9W9KBX0_9EURO|nr:FAD-dependent pyridine nucleotide-disulfide oxidoreductase [Penicillium argentinense]KAJ5100096.1 FAD-dependent pyridine nucleotide-disulfide oxidoreductase [Penicillium argentinense]